MSEVKYTGSGNVDDADFRAVKWVGTTKGGKAITIEMLQSLNKSNLELAFVEKDDTTLEVEFEGAYVDSDLASGNLKEPWTINFADGAASGDAGEILLGAGVFYVGTAGATPTTKVALTRGGGSFTVEREYREIKADGDPGLVKGRISKDEGRPKLKLKALQWLTNMTNLYPAIEAVT